MDTKMRMSNRCSKCGAKLPADAKFCDVCGAPCTSPEQKAFVNKGILAAIAVLLIALAVAAVFFGISKARQRSMDEYREEISLVDVETTITAEEYDKIELGMKRAEVEAVIGGPGKKCYDEYRWPGVYYNNDTVSESYAGFTFEGADLGLSKKEECDIKDAEEIEKFTKLGPDEYEKIDSPLVELRQLTQIEQGMAYQQAVSILGGEGMIMDSRSVDSIIEGHNIIKRYAWKCMRGGKYSYIRISFENDKVMRAPSSTELKGIE